MYKWFIIKNFLYKIMYINLQIWFLLWISNPNINSIQLILLCILLLKIIKKILPKLGNFIINFILILGLYNLVIIIIINFLLYFEYNLQLPLGGIQFFDNPEDYGDQPRRTPRNFAKVANIQGVSSIDTETPLENTVNRADQPFEGPSSDELIQGLPSPILERSVPLSGNSYNESILNQIYLQPDHSVSNVFSNPVNGPLEGRPPIIDSGFSVNTHIREGELVAVSQFNSDFSHSDTHSHYINDNPIIMNSELIITNYQESLDNNQSSINNSLITSNEVKKTFYHRFKHICKNSKNYNSFKEKFNYLFKKTK